MTGNNAEKQVLLVEDNRLSSEMAKAELKGMGFGVTVVSDGEQAVSLMKTTADKSFDFVLMDIRMPVMDGITATRQIRAMNRVYLQTVPIIALTSSTFKAEIDDCLAAGMNAYMGKPFEPEELRKILEDIKAKQ